MKVPAEVDQCLACACGRCDLCSDGTAWDEFSKRSRVVIICNCPHGQGILPDVRKPY